MDGFASTSIRAASPAGKALGLAEALLATLALALSLIGIPGTPATHLDASWQLVLIHAHDEGLQFGRQIIFTWGPWGFLCNGYHMGRACASAILLWQTVGQLGIALTLVALTRSLVAWRRIAFVLLFLAFHWIFTDVAYFVLISLIVVEGLMRQRASWVRLICFALALGFLGQLKFTYFILASAGVVAAAACWVARHSWPRAAVVASAFVASFVGAWAAAGQDLDNLYPYLRRGLEVASGYGDAMGLDEPWPVFLWGAAAALAVACFLFCVRKRHPDGPRATAACAFLAFAFFVMWKESFTRADLVPFGGHVFGFFCLVIVMAPVMPGLFLPGRRLHWLDACVPLCLVAIAQFDPALYSGGPRIMWERYYGNSHALARLGSLPGEWQDAYLQACAEASLPRVREAVGRSTLDVYDFSTAVALMNGLNLDSRPIFQSYCAYTPSLEGWNLRFYQSPRAPDYLLWNEERIDDRFPGEDDALLVAALPGHYTPVLKERGYWLLRRTSALPQVALERRHLVNRRVRLSEEIEVPAAPGRALWLQANAVPTLLGRARAFLYKPSTLLITTTDDGGHTYAWRFLPRVARSGFMLSPVITTGDDAAALFRGQSRITVKSFHFEAPGDQAEFWDHVEVALFALPDVPVHPYVADESPADSPR
jgi:hypothetical protein